MAEELDEDAGFPDEEVQECLQRAIEMVLEKETDYDETKVAKQVNDITEKTMSNLAVLKLAYKYMVNVMIVQKSDRPLYNCFSTSMENGSDGYITVTYPPQTSKESFPKTITCFACVFALRV